MNRFEFCTISIKQLPAKHSGDITVWVSNAGSPNEHMLKILHQGFTEVGDKYNEERLLKHHPELNRVIAKEFRGFVDLFEAEEFIRSRHLCIL